MSARTYARVSATAHLERYEVKGDGAPILVDGAPARGGIGEAITPVPLFFASLGACTASAFEFWARELGGDIAHIEVVVEAERGEDGPVPFTRVIVRADVWGASRTLLSSVEERYRATCPVFNTITAAVPVDLVISARRSRKAKQPPAA